MTERETYKKVVIASIVLIFVVILTVVAILSNLETFGLEEECSECDGTGKVIDQYGEEKKCTEFDCIGGMVRNDTAIKGIAILGALIIFASVIIAIVFGIKYKAIKNKPSSKKGFCDNCGVKLSGKKFCSSCGERIKQL